jgi:thioredoxin 1
MTESASEKSERERIREQKREELLEKYGHSETGRDGVPDEPIEIEDGTHFERVTDDYHVVLVDCYAEWCGPCQMMEPTIDSLAAETDGVVVKVDVDAHKQLAAQLGVQGVPTLVLYVDGEPVERLVGAQDEATLTNLVQEALAQ